MLTCQLEQYPVEASLELLARYQSSVSVLIHSSRNARTLPKYLGNVTIQARTELNCWDGIPPIRGLAPQHRGLGARAEDNTILKDRLTYSNPIRTSSESSMLNAAESSTSSVVALNYKPLISAEK